MKKKYEEYLKKDHEYYKIVKPVLEDEEFQKRKQYMHHENRSVYEHCITVSILSYLWAKKWKLDYKAAALGGLLHDFYDKPWQTQDNKLIQKEHVPLFQKHGFVHAKQAASNAHKYYPQLMNDKIDNIIRRHMFPLNIHPPKYKESWIITTVDKYVSMEVLKTPDQLLKYVGIGKKTKEEKK